jgi:RimJ/RimL family protein N-acetyltransferase/catechol 2,3-dioxygenase-like lactoylglutathione lyase family enzyme
MEWWHRPVTSSLAESRQVVTDMLEHDAGQWVLGVHGSEEVLGHVGFVSDLNPGGHAGFGYALRRSHWGFGYATEAAHAALAYGFGDVGITRAELWIHRSNHRSIRVAEKLGCQRRAEAHLRYAVGPTPSLIYGVTAAEWRGEVEPPPVIYSVSPILQVSDVAAAARWWHEALGFHIDFIHGDPPSVAVVTIQPRWTGSDSVQLRLAGTAASDDRGAIYVTAGPGIDALVEQAIASGAEVVTPIADRPWGMREVEFRDPDGNVVRVGAPS